MPGRGSEDTGVGKEFSVRGAVVVAVLVLVCSSCSNGEPDVEGGTPVTSEQAQVLAEKAFVRATEGTVTKYTVTSFGDTSTHWGFVVEGTDEFARPGYAWIVNIDRTNGAAEITSGM